MVSRRCSAAGMSVYGKPLIAGDGADGSSAASQLVGSLRDKRPSAVRVMTAYALDGAAFPDRWSAALSQSAWAVLGQAVDDVGGNRVSQSATHGRA
jgi:hypothetical protein